MNRIIFPLKPCLQGAPVADLQDALQLCLDRHAVVVTDDGSGRELSAALKRERLEEIYGDATGKLVSMVQRGRRLNPSGEVDEATANAFNALLKEWGLLDQPTEPTTPQYQVDGKFSSSANAGASAAGEFAVNLILRCGRLCGLIKQPPLLEQGIERICSSFVHLAAGIQASTSLDHAHQLASRIAINLL